MHFSHLFPSPRCIFLGESRSSNVFVFSKPPMLGTLVSFLSSFVSSTHYPPPLIRAREAAKSSAALLSTLAGLLGDLGHDGRVLCLSPWDNVQGLWSSGWNVAGLDITNFREKSNCWVTSKLQGQCRKVSGLITEDFFPVTALYIEPQQAQFLWRHL